eukprot:scaffold34280_cov18-Tisochrysis_lutea.AAC.4
MQVDMVFRQLRGHGAPQRRAAAKALRGSAKKMPGVQGEMFRQGRAGQQKVLVSKVPGVSPVPPVYNCL